MCCVVCRVALEGSKSARGCTCWAIAPYTMQIPVAFCLLTPLWRSIQYCEARRWSFGHSIMNYAVWGACSRLLGSDYGLLQGYYRPK